MSQFSDFIEGYNAVRNYQKIARETEDRRLATEIFNRNFNQAGVVAPRQTPTDSSTQRLNIPKSTLEAVDFEKGVETFPLRQESPIMDTSTPTGFATDYTTDVNPTSPFKTYEQSGAESPANMPYGFGAIPKDYQPMEGNVDTTPTPEPTATIEQGPMFSTMPSSVKEQLANAKTEDEYNNILNSYKKETPVAKEKSFYDKTVQEVTSAENKLNSHQQELAKIKKVANEMRSNGLFKEAEAYETKALDAQKSVYEATNEYNKVLSKAMDFKAGLADSFLKAVENGADPDAAWAYTIMRAHSLGIPDMDQLAGLKGQERIQVAQMIKDEAVSTKDRIKTDLEIMKEEGKKQRANKNIAFKQETNTLKDRWHREDRELKSRNLDIKEALANFSMSNKMVANLRADLKIKQARLDKLRTGDYITDEFGMTLQGAEREREARLLDQEINDVQERLEAAEKHTDSYRQIIPKSELKKIENESKTEEQEKVVENTMANITQKNVDQVTDAINKNPTQVAAITKAFEEQHPGLSITIDKKTNTIKVIAKAK